MNISSIHTNISNTNEKSLNATDNSTFRSNFNLTKVNYLKFIKRNKNY